LYRLLVTQVILSGPRLRRNNATTFDTRKRMPGEHCDNAASCRNISLEFTGFGVTQGAGGMGQVDADFRGRRYERHGEYARGALRGCAAQLRHCD